VKILLDQNISYRLVSKIKPIFPGIDHVKNVGLTNKLDKITRDYAKSEGFTIATFDSDFLRFKLTLRASPKVDLDKIQKYNYPKSH
jgi:predicted nuclease of predicted toxin-antitoxin system